MEKFIKLTDRVREYIKCPEFGSKHYGAWGALRTDQRELIYKLCRQSDIFEKAADDLMKENISLKNEIKVYKKALELSCERIKNMYEQEQQYCTNEIENFTQLQSDFFINQARDNLDEEL